MNQDTSLGEKKADMADINLSKIRPSQRKHREIPPEFPDHIYLPSLGSRSLENKKFQGTDHQQVQNEESSKRHGTVCIVGMKSRKVEAPRNESDEDPQILTTQGIEQFLRNVDIWHEDFIVGTQNPSSHLPSEEFVPSNITYGTNKALEKLALTYESGKGCHGVYTDRKYDQVFQGPFQAPKSVEELGRGSFGKITKYRWPSGSEFVLKMVEIEKFNPTEAIFTNAASHPNILKSHGLLFESGMVGILMDYAGQRLPNIVRQWKQPSYMNNDIIRILMRDLIRGLAYMESQKMINCDIKPDNLCVQGDWKRGYLLKIVDLGGIQESDKDQISLTALTPEYISPEMAKMVLKRVLERKGLKPSFLYTEQELERRLSPKADVFAAALVVDYMYLRKNMLPELLPEDLPSFPQRMNIIWHLSDQDTYQKKLYSKLIPESADEEMKIILRGMLQYDVNERSSATELLEVLESSKDRYRNARLPKRRDVGKEFKKQSSTSQILKEPPELRRRMVKDELKRKLLKNQMSAVPDKFSRFTEPDHKMGESSKAGLFCNERKISVDGNQKGSMQAILLTDGQLEGFQTHGLKIELPTQGYQTGCFMKGDQMGLSKGNTQQFNQASLPWEQPIYNVDVSEKNCPVCHATGDLAIHDPIQEFVPGNLPNFKLLGIDSE